MFQKKTQQKIQQDSQVMRFLFNRIFPDTERLKPTSKRKKKGNVIKAICHTAKYLCEEPQMEAEVFYLSKLLWSSKVSRGKAG